MDKIYKTVRISVTGTELEKTHYQRKIDVD